VVFLESKELLIERVLLLDPGWSLQLKYPLGPGIVYLNIFKVIRKQVGPHIILMLLIPLRDARELKGRAVLGWGLLSHRRCRWLYIKRLEYPPVAVIYIIGCFSLNYICVPSPLRVHILSHFCVHIYRLYSLMIERCIELGRSCPLSLQYL
jgi:hypothetical protein